MTKKKTTKKTQPRHRQSARVVATGGTVPMRGRTIIPCLEDSMTDVLHMRNEHGRVRKVLTVDQYLHHKRYKGKNAALLTARSASGTVYTLPVDPKLAATPADPFRTAGATASS
jgi:hypothetical protein